MIPSNRVFILIQGGNGEFQRLRISKSTASAVSPLFLVAFIKKSHF